ncbi:MAG: T9SS type A sorting domain-containing protein [Candidatus Azobacteroides sp.]|nr:T9SS type A sorting domain-containing protein [Candidatus Azobacteroides sp.]
MRKSVLTFVTLIGYYTFLAAYDYQAIYSDHPALFSIEGKIVTSEIDSVHMQGADSVFYPVKEMRENPEIGYCLLPFPSWLGEKIVIQDGLNIFLNLENEEIHIKTDAELNETWTVYRKEDDIRIEGKVITHETEEFLGIEDLIKTISFQMYDKDDNPVEIYLPSVKISRSHGFIAAVNFICFPYVPENLNYLYFEGYNYLSTPELVGLTYPEAGIQNLTWREVYDFQPGDEIHVMSEDWWIHPFNGKKDGIASKRIIKYLTRTDHEDYTLYTCEETFSIQEFYFEKSTYRKDITEIKIEANPEFDLLPQKIYELETTYPRSIFSYSSSMEVSEPVSKIPPVSYMCGITEWSDNCWEYISTDSPYLVDLEEIYLKGFGGPYYESKDRDSSIRGLFSRLVYYKKGDKTWGTPLEIVNSLQKNQADYSLMVYPNPVKDILWIEGLPANKAFIIEIRDISGRIILTEEIEQINNSISFTDMTKGIYLYSIKEQNRIICSGKIIKQE